MQELSSKISKLLKYYIKDSEEISVPLRYSFDNLLISNEESQIARSNFLQSNESLLYGEDLKNYQRELANYIGVDESHILLFYTAHGGLFFLLQHLKNMYPDKSKVIVPAFTCTVVTNAVTAAGLEPVFVDIDTDTYSLNIANLEEIIKKKSNTISAVIVQHLFGFVVKNYEEIVDLCKSYNIIVIGDCAPSLGALHKGKSIGLLEDFAIFSSQSSKSINTYTGGFLLINREIKDIYEDYEKLNYPDIEHVKSILKAYYLQYTKKVMGKWYLPFFLARNRRNFIPSVHPLEMLDNHVVGLQAPILEGNKVYTRKFPNILAKIGLVQLSKLEGFIKRRTEAKDYILRNFGGELVVMPHSRPALLRIPIMKDEEYKGEVRYEKNCLVGAWFPYYFGNCSNAKEAAKKLVNYVKIEDYDNI